MTKEEIMKLIEDDVSVDIYGDLNGHERVAEIIATHIMYLNAEIERLREETSDMAWHLAQFNEDELSRIGWL